MDGCGVCMVGEAMEQFAIEWIDHMGWDAGSGQPPGPNPNKGADEGPVTLQAAEAALV